MVTTTSFPDGMLFEQSSPTSCAKEAKEPETRESKDKKIIPTTCSMFHSISWRGYHLYTYRMGERLSVAQRSYCARLEPGALCGSGELVNLGRLMTYGAGLRQVTSQGLG